jgi:3',5'-cyclic-nucleotide phosphodiesterase
MEDDLGIPTALFAPPIRDNIVELAKSQISFMNLFVLPLFQGVADILPAMQFSVDEIQCNKGIWERKIVEETKMQRTGSDPFRRLKDESGMLSPRTQSLANPSEPPRSDSPPPPLPTQLDRPTSYLSLGKSTSDDASSQSSLGTLNQLVGGTSQLQANGNVDGTSRRSSGAFLSTLQPPQPIQDSRRSSNTMPSQLQLDFGPTGFFDFSPSSGGASENDESEKVQKLDKDTDKTKERDSGTEAVSRSTASDSSVVTTVLASPPVHITARTASTKCANHRRSSTERSSLPSSQDRCSQATSATNVPYSPSTQATSFLSVESAASEKQQQQLDETRPRTSPAAPASASHKHNIKTTVITDPVKKVGKRPSRFRLTQFWRRGLKANHRDTDENLNDRRC